MLREIIPNALYNSANLADILGLNLQTVQKLLKTGGLPGFKVGRRWYVVGRDLLAMGQTGKSVASDPPNQ